MKSFSVYPFTFWYFSNGWIPL